MAKSFTDNGTGVRPFFLHRRSHRRGNRAISRAGTEVINGMTEGERADRAF